MKTSKQCKIALNRHLILFALIGLICIDFAQISFLEHEIGAGVAMAVFGALLLVVPVVFMPWWYRFDPQGVSIKYIFLSDERYLWKNVRSICVVEAISDNGRQSLFWRDFRLDGKVEGKKRRYMDSRICKNRRTKRLIKQYWNGTIKGYWHDEVQAVKKWNNQHCKRKQKKN